MLSLQASSVKSVKIAFYKFWPVFDNFLVSFEQIFESMSRLAAFEIHYCILFFATIQSWIVLQLTQYLKNVRKKKHKEKNHKNSKFMIIESSVWCHLKKKVSSFSAVNFMRGFILPPKCINLLKPLKRQRENCFSPQVSKIWRIFETFFPN